MIVKTYQNGNDKTFVASENFQPSADNVEYQEIVKHLVLNIQQKEITKANLDEVKIDFNKLKFIPSSNDELVFQMIYRSNPSIKNCVPISMASRIISNIKKISIEEAEKFIHEYHFTEEEFNFVVDHNKKLLDCYGS